MTNKSDRTGSMASKLKPGPKAKPKKLTSSKGEAGVGRLAELRDHERAIGLPIKYADDRHPMQAAPDHGPHK
jgi:hypothetical protein